MSRMKEMYLDIELMLEQGDHPTKIAQVLDVPLSLVYDVLESMSENTEY
jgi:sugar-specific transcriptional regulator TrmB